MYQQLTLIGNVGNIPELRYTPSGVAVCNLSIAINKRWTDSEGASQEKTTWFRITAWRRQAEIISEYVQKGSRIMVIGEVEEARPYVDREGNQQAALEVTATDFRFLENRAQNGVIEKGGAVKSTVENGQHQKAETAAEIPI